MPLISPHNQWGHSSVGRALQWHCRGRGFDSPWLHQPSPLRASAGKPATVYTRAACPPKLRSSEGGRLRAIAPKERRRAGAELNEPSNDGLY